MGSSANEERNPDDVADTDSIDAIHAGETAEESHSSAEAGFADSISRLKAFLGLLLEPNSNPRELKSAYAALKAAIKTSREDFLQRVSLDTENDSDASEWVILELLLDPSVLTGAQRKGALASIKNIKVREIGAALTNSVWISSKSFADDLAKSLPRRERETAILGHSSSDHVLLNVQDNNLWRPPVTTEGVSSPFDTIEWVLLERLASAGARLSQELVSRFELCKLQLVSRDESQRDLRKNRRGLRVLESILVFAADLPTATSPEELTERAYRLVLAESIGYRQNVWFGLNGARNKVLSARYDESPERDYWASIVVVSWVSTDDADSRLSDIPIDQLVAVWRCAKDRNLDHLQNRVLRGIQERAEDGDISRSDLARVVDAFGSVPSLRDWLSKVRIRIDPEFSVSDLADVDKHSQAAALFFLVEATEPTPDFARSLRGRVASLDACAVIAPLALTVRRFQSAIQRRKAEDVQNAAHGVRQLARALDKMLSDLQQSLQGIPSDLGSRARTAIDRLAVLADSLAETPVDTSNAELRERPSDPEAGDNETSLLDALLALEGLASNSPERRRVMRSKAIALLENSDDDQDGIREALQNASIPPEGYAVIWETGLRKSATHFFSTSIDVLDNSTWGARVFLDVIERVVSDKPNPVALNKVLAVRARDLLLDKIEVLSDGLVAGDTKKVAKVISEAEHQREVVVAAFDSLMNNLQQIRAMINEA